MRYYIDEGKIRRGDRPHNIREVQQMTKLRFNVLITVNPGTRAEYENFEMFDDEASARAFIAANANPGDEVDLSRMAVRETAIAGLWRPFEGGEYTRLPV